MAMAVSALSKGIVNRIILTRPAVEAGESLGFLPGDLAEKVDPYLRPLYDALTRIGFNSKAVITGDITQIDLPAEKASGLVETKNILQGIEGIKFVFFTKKDVVRHKLVQEIIRAYEELEVRKQEAKSG